MNEHRKTKGASTLTMALLAGFSGWVAYRVVAADPHDKAMLAYKQANAMCIAQRPTADCTPFIPLNPRP